MTIESSDYPLSRRINAVLRLDPELPAIEAAGRWFNWGELRQLAGDINTALHEAGVGSGEGVGILLRNCPQIVGAVLAVLASQRCIVCLSPFYPPLTLARELRELRLRAVIGDAADWRHVELTDAMREVGGVGIAVCFDGAPAARFVQGLERQTGRGHHPPMPGIAIDMLTSGTTGAPKRVQRTYAAVSHDVLAVSVPNGALDEVKVQRSPTIVAAPLVHVSGLSGVLWPICETRPLMLLEKFTPEAWAGAVERGRVRYGSLPPAAVRMVLDANIAPSRLASLVAIRSGTAPLTWQTQIEFEQTFGIPVLVQYGSTELSGIAAWSIEDHREFRESKVGSVGRAVRGNRIRVVDPESGKELPPGETGLLEAMLPRQSDPSQQWIRTTDMASMDADGFIYIHGRVDDVIIRGGFKVNAQAVVSALREHPDVRDASVVGIDDHRLGQVPVAALETRNPALSEQKVREFASRHLAGYQMPVKFRLVEALPRTPSLKVDLQAVRELFREPGDKGEQ